ncbi:MAG: hypothetical protein ATN35_13415 [Epulopiscium sp. Nele67-Bin004]|nr:MAG: hypothetical protein ATN35_13415 [Epulopiscium sp. Nele67-Bin004]
MPNILTDLGEAPRKELHIFYVLDTSGSMEGSKIASVNRAMEECTEALRTLAKNNGDAKLKIAVLEFNSGCRWVTNNGPENMDDFEWEDLQAGGVTDIGSALEELDEKLSRHHFLESMTGALMPVIIVMTDGYATDSYDESLLKIRENRWFKHSTKIGFVIGDDADENMITSIVGNSEAVIKTSDLDLFKRLMKFITVTSSVLVSKLTTDNKDDNGSTVVKNAMIEFDLDNNDTDAQTYDEEQDLEQNSDEVNDIENEPEEDDDDWDDLAW